MVCGEPASHTHRDQPCHLGDCALELDSRQVAATTTAGHAPNLTAQQLPDLDEDTTASAAVDEHGEDTSPAQPGRAAQAGEESSSAEADDQAQAAADRVQPRQIAVAVADVDGLHLPDGQVLALPEHLVSFDQLLDLAYEAGVGWRSKICHEGPQVWCTEALCAQVGALLDEMPTSIEATDNALLELGKDLAWLQPAEVSGWQSTDKLGAWMSVKHPTRGRGRLVHLPYCTGQMHLQMTDDDPDATVLARRLQNYAQLLGMPYRISSATTGIDLMHAVRPRPKPERSGRRVTAVQRPVAMPPLFEDRRWRIEVDAETYLCRKPRDFEAAHTYLHWYDRNGQYLAAANRLQVGADDDPVHHPDGTRLDPKRPGWVRIPAVEWQHPMLPNPWLSPINGEAYDERWMATTFALYLAELDYDLEIREGWIWERSIAYLDPWYTIMRDARMVVEAHRHDNADAAAIRPDLKGTYTRGEGKLADPKLRDSPHAHHQAMYRPDWYSVLRGKARANLLRLIRATAKISQWAWPVAVAEDAIAYTSDDPDPMSAWPGDPTKIRDANDPDQPTITLGGVKPYKSVLLADVVDLLPVQPPAETTQKILERCTDAADWRAA